MPDLEYYLGTEKDDAALRAVLHNTPMGGSIRLKFVREPSFFGIKHLEGPFHQTIVGRDKNTGKIFGVTNRSIRDLFVNGSVQKIGYLSLMRMIKEYQTGFPAIRGYQFCRELHKDLRTKFYLTSIMEDNQIAIKLLKSGVRGLPRYQEYTRFCTRSIPIRSKPRKVKRPSSFSISKCSVNDKKILITFLNEYGKNHQFYPNWTIDTLFHHDYTPGLKESDMLIARKKDKIVGCMAMWDQRAFRQTIVCGYQNGLSRVTWLVNSTARIFGYPQLPRTNAELKSCFISHVAIEGNDPEIFKMLLIHCHNTLIESEVEYMVVGFSDFHPFNNNVTSIFYNVPTYSHIYLVSWEEDGIDPLGMIDNRLPGIEVAIL